MVRTRNQAKSKRDNDYQNGVDDSVYEFEDIEEFETPQKYFKEAEKDDLRRALADSLEADSINELSVSPSFNTVVNYLRAQGFSLPRFYKDLHKVLEMMESDEVAGTRMMLVYFYHNNPNSQKFLENVLIDKRFVEIVKRNFLVWTADMSQEEDKVLVEEQLEWELSKDVVDLVKQYEVEQFPLLMVVMLLQGEHRVMKLFSGVGNVITLCQGLSESVTTYRSIVQENDDQEVTETAEKLEKVDHVTPKSYQDNPTTPVLVELQVGPCLHPVQFFPKQQLVDLLQYVSRQTGLEVGKFSLSSYPGTDLTLAWDTLTFNQLGLKGGARVRLRIGKK